MQTFVLAPQSEKKYYVHNDIFRYQDQVFNDDCDADDAVEELQQDNGLGEELQQPTVLPHDLPVAEAVPVVAAPPGVTPSPLVSAAPIQVEYAPVVAAPTAMAAPAQQQQVLGHQQGAGVAHQHLNGGVSQELPAVQSSPVVVPAVPHHPLHAGGAVHAAPQQMQSPPQASVAPHQQTNSHLPRQV